jgi:peptide/nickel transport system permease protein
VQALLTLVAVSVVVFLSARLTGSPEFVMLSPDARPEDLAAFRHAYGLDRSLPEQYFLWAGHVLQGDFGRGIHFAEPIFGLITRRLGNSLALAGVAVSMSLLLAVPLGVVAATSRRQLRGRAASAVGAAGQAVPSFWLGMILVLIFAVGLRVLPASGASSWQHYILPGFTIGLFITAGTMRLIRSAMLDILGAEFLKFARAKGAPEHVVIWKHALRNALLPAVTFVSYMFGSIIATSITVETVFNWPGMGSLVFEGILRRDFPVVQGVVLVWASIVIIVNLLIDLLYLVLDPRVRVGK